VRLRDGMVFAIVDVAYLNRLAADAETFAAGLRQLGERYERLTGDKLPRLRSA
jgi:hypothetical protein